MLSESKYEAICFSMQQADQVNLALCMFLVDKVPGGDLIFNGRDVFVPTDKRTAEVLEQAEIDLVIEGEDKHFVLTNTMACGCGYGDSAGIEQENA